MRGTPSGNPSQTPHECCGLYFSKLFSASSRKLFCENNAVRDDRDDIPIVEFRRETDYRFEYGHSTDRWNLVTAASTGNDS